MTRQGGGPQSGPWLDGLHSLKPWACSGGGIGVGVGGTGVAVGPGVFVGGTAVAVGPSVAVPVTVGVPGPGVSVGLAGVPDEVGLGLAEAPAIAPAGEGDLALTTVVVRAAVRPSSAPVAAGVPSSPLPMAIATTTSAARMITAATAIASIRSRSSRMPDARRDLGRSSWNPGGGNTGVARR